MLVALHCFAASVDAARRAAALVDGRLAAAVHATAGLKFTAVTFMVLAFYALIWPDATFQRDSVARRVRRCSAAVARLARMRAEPPWPARVHRRRCLMRHSQEAQGIPFGRYMHEIHALPAVFIVADLAGALQPQLLARHAPSARVAAAQAMAFGAAWTLVQELNRLATGAAPYAILAVMPLRARLVLDVICLTAVACIALAFRAAIVRRAGASAAATAPAKKRR